MTKLKEFIRLDYMTVKPYFTGKNLLIFSAVALFLTTMSESVSSGIGVGLMIATLFISYPFVLSEKANLDALYVTMSVSRKTVVRGRYLFILILNISAVIYAFILASAGLLIANVVGFSSGGGDEGYLMSSLILSAIFLLIECVQLPIYFKLTYTKAKLLSIVPFLTLMVGYMAFMALRNISADVAILLSRISIGNMIIPLSVALMLAAVYISYSLSVTFYTKREF